MDRRNFHLSSRSLTRSPLAALSPGEVCAPLRAIFRRHQNVQVVLGEVVGFDLDPRRLDVRSVVGEGVTRSLEYDTLIVAGGSHYSYFGHDEWRDAAPEVKSLESAVAVRARLLAAFEAAELEDDEARRPAWLTFVVVGGGPTGVEMAGQSPSWPATRCGATSARSTRATRACCSSRRPTACSRRSLRRCHGARPTSSSIWASRRCSSARSSPSTRRASPSRPPAAAGALRGPHRDLGGGGHRVGTGAPPRRAERRRARPGGPHRR